MGRRGTAAGRGQGARAAPPDRRGRFPGGRLAPGPRVGVGRRGPRRPPAGQGRQARPAPADLILSASSARRCRARFKDLFIKTSLTCTLTAVTFPFRQHTDPQTLRALAHPIRLKLLEQLMLHGPATATELAERIDE